MLSKEEVLGRGLELNLDDGEKNVIFLENFWIRWLEDICDIVLL